MAGDLSLRVQIQALTHLLKLNKKYVPLFKKEYLIFDSINCSANPKNSTDTGNRTVEPRVRGELTNC